MSDLFDFKRKIKFTVLYKNVFCSFIPYQQTSYEKLPAVIQGVVVYPEVGEYNPNSWAKPLTVEKRYIIRKCDMNKTLHHCL